MQDVSPSTHTETTFLRLSLDPNRAEEDFGAALLAIDTAESLFQAMLLNPNAFRVTNPGGRLRPLLKDLTKTLMAPAWKEALDAESDQEEEDLGLGSSRQRPRRSPSPQASRSVTVFDNIASIFGRPAPSADSPPHSRRASLSSRTSRPGLLRRASSRRSDAGSDYALTSEGEEDGDDRWGYASEEEDYDSDEESDTRRETESMDLRSLDERLLPDSPGPSLPLMAGDPIFGGEERIDMGELDLLDPPPPGPPSRQTIYIADEDAHIRFVGYEIIPTRFHLWRLFTVLTCGILGLLGHWFPRMWLRWVAQEKAFKDTKDGFVVVEVGVDPASRTVYCSLTEYKSAYRDIALFPVRKLDYPYHISTVFPNQLPESSSRTPILSANGNGSGASGLLDHLLIVDYRYARFALDPRTGLFNLIR